MLWAPYRTIDELVAAPEALLGDSDLFTLLDQPGAGTFPVPRSVLRMSRSSATPAARAPLVGEHTDEVLRSVLGLAPAAVARLRDQGVIGGG